MSKREPQTIYATRQFTVGNEIRTKKYEIGKMWPHEKGNGWNLELAATPVNGKAVAFEPLPPKEEAEEPTGGDIPVTD